MTRKRFNKRLGGIGTSIKNRRKKVLSHVSTFKNNSERRVSLTTSASKTIQTEIQLSNNIILDLSHSKSEPKESHLDISNKTLGVTTSLSALGPQKKRLNHKYQANMRIAISMLFERRYYSTYLSKNLNEIVKKICITFQYHNHATVKRVILNTKESLDLEIAYDARRKQFQREDNRKIKEDSFEEHLVTRLIENGNRYKTSTKTFNAVHRAPTNLPRIGVKAVYNAIKRTNHIVTSTTDIQQTNENNLLHRQARYNWFCQILVRMGYTIPPPKNDEEVAFRNRLKDEWIDSNRIKEDGYNFVLEQVGFFDEIHMIQVIGTDKKYQVMFSRNEDGIYDKNGKFEEIQRKVRINI